MRQTLDIEFRILGPFEARKADRVLQLGGARQRSFLAVLVLHANQTVSRDRLIADLRADEPPGTAAKMIQNYVSQLRKGLGPEALVTRPQGYELQVDANGIDARRFEA